MTINIRKALPSDAENLAAVFLDSRRRAFFWQDLARFQLEDFEKQTVGEVVFLAENKEGIVLGFISVWEHESPPFIHHLFITPDHQRKGIGRLLIQSLFSWLPLPYRLKCMTKNKKALAFYRDIGWIEVDQGFGEGEAYFLLELYRT